MRKKKVNRVLALLMSAVLMAGNIPVYAADADEEGTDQVTVIAAEDDADPEEELSADTPEEDPTVPEEETDTSFEDAVDIRGDCFIEDHTIKSYSGNHKAILIPETYWDNNTHDHREVSAIAEGVFRDHTELEEVYFAKNTNHIGAYAFSGTSIKKITFLGAMSNIGSYAFANCPELEEVVFQADDEITIDNWGDGTFRNCPKLKKITLSNKCVSLPRNVRSLKKWYGLRN